MFTVTGPFNPTGPGDTPSRRAVFTCRPATRAEEEPCARKIITTLARRAYRGESTGVDLERLFGFYRSGPPPAAGSSQGGTFEKGIQTALQRILASPKFVLPHRAGSGRRAAVDRLPDQRSRTGLAPVVLPVEQHSGRPAPAISPRKGTGSTRPPSSNSRCGACWPIRRPSALTTNFAGQWLYLRNLKNMQPNSEEFPDFDDNLRQAFEQEASLFFESIVREDRNVLDLMTADYTFLNERLARHYGIPNIYGSQFRRVTLTDDTRKGLLGKGAVLMVTSHTDRTSPVVRGKWILDNLLGAPAAAAADQRAAAQRKSATRAAAF